MERYAAVSYTHLGARADIRFFVTKRFPAPLFSEMRRGSVSSRRNGYLPVRPGRMHLRHMQWRKSFEPVRTLDVYKRQAAHRPRGHRDAGFYERRHLCGHQAVSYTHLFFKGHVAVYAGGGRFIHASASAGKVVYGSIEPDDELYLPELHKNLLHTGTVF